MVTEVVKLKAGGYKIPVKIVQEGHRLFFNFKFNRPLMNEIKLMEGRKYHGYDDENPRRIWSIPITQRNMFQLAYLKGDNPYAHYDQPLLDIQFERPLYTHQGEMTRQGLTRHYCIFACEMGTGKTLAAIEIMERSNEKDWWWIGPRSALEAVQLEFLKWDCKIMPRLFTYEGMKRELENWTDGAPAPIGVIFDESSKLKTPTSQRSQAALQLANAIRKEHGNNGFAIEMTGSPAPKSPLDWWNQCEVACPGFIREGTIHNFKDRLGLYKMKETTAGQTYPHLITWWDDETKCAVCGQPEYDDIHDADFMSDDPDFHGYKPSTNEVSRLYKRMHGLVLVKFKRDCLDLPEKQYRLIRLEPEKNILRAAGLVTANATRAATALTLLRELSDGFQYEEIPEGEQECPRCKGTGFVTEPVPIGDGEVEFDVPTEFEDVEMFCPTCGGAKEIPKTHRESTQIPCPKEDVLKDLLEEHEEVGRLVIYAGFTGSVDRCTDICLKEGWAVIRVDGRGWLGISKDDELMPRDKLLQIFQYGKKEFPRVAFVGQPGAAGMGLTLTASPSIFYWSNTFNAEDRIQSEDRIHRPGMDKNLGATIIDCIHLPSDEHVLENLRKKKELQDMSMGVLRDAFKEAV